MIALRPATLETVRPLRLRALREDPDAFGSTLESELDRPDADWDFWVPDSIIAFDVGPAALTRYSRSGACSPGQAPVTCSNERAPARSTAARVTLNAIPSTAAAARTFGHVAFLCVGFGGS